MNSLSEIVSNFNPWFLTGFAISLIIADIFLFSTTVLIGIGLGLAFPIISNILDLHPQLQLWSYPFGLLIGFLIQPALMKKLTTETHPYELEKQFLGARGIVVLTISENNSETHFYEYKSEISNETAPTKNFAVVGAKIKLKSGETFPIEGPTENLKNDAEAIVKGFNGNAAIVELL